MDRVGRAMIWLLAFYWFKKEELLVTSTSIWIMLVDMVPKQQSQRTHKDVEREIQCCDHLSSTRITVYKFTWPRCVWRSLQSHADAEKEHDMKMNRIDVHALVSCQTWTKKHKSD